MDNVLEPTLVVWPTLESEIVHVSPVTSVWIIVPAVVVSSISLFISSPSHNIKNVY